MAATLMAGAAHATPPTSSQVEAPGRFCNADMALHTLLHLPLPRDYAGGKAPDGRL